jgi:purine-binding chemotaxis protein CheW
MSDHENTNALHDSKEFLTFFVNEQIFGLPVLQVQDVLGEQKVTPIPLAPPEVSGSLNLRGRIVTALNVRQRLKLEDKKNSQKKMSIVVDYKNELYSLEVDRVGDVVSLPDHLFEKNPATLDPAWRHISAGIYRLNDQLLVILDTAGLLEPLMFKEDVA